MSTHNDQIIIETRELSLSYKRGSESTSVLRGVNLTIRRGELVAIQGPSGSGKSTLFYLLGGLLRPTSGSIIIAGKSLAKMSDNELATFRNRNLGFVFQQFHLLPRASVLSNIMLPAQYANLEKKEAQAKANVLAERLGLEERLKHEPNQLSGGQQQRVAIARALLLDVDLILADEPTGNLDSQNGSLVLETLFELNRQGKTVVIVTHEQEVAAQCQRQIVVRDGMIVDDSKNSNELSSFRDSEITVSTPLTTRIRRPERQVLLKDLYNALPVAFNNLIRNKAKSFLTMFGVILGTAAVLAVITLGEYSKTRILEGYEAMGVNKITFRGNHNWRNTKPEPGVMPFTSFNWQKDLEPLRTIFPEITMLSPSMNSWQTSVIYGGRTLNYKDIMILGVNEFYLAIMNGSIRDGTWLTSFNVKERDPVCVVGSEIAQGLGQGSKLIGSLISLTLNQQSTFPCRVIGIKTDQSSNNDWVKPNKQILIPYTYFQVVGDSWSSQIRSAAMKVADASTIEETGKKIRKFFELKYGNTGDFHVDNDSTMVAQMKRFLSIFSLMLFGIALLSLIVGGIGIHNMMMVAITERLREIGLRKAVGATGRSILLQVLFESTFICVVAGIIGIAFGFAACGGLMYAATKVIPNLKFEWVFNIVALIISGGAVVATGVISGLVPAFKAQRLQVIEALRSE